MPYIAKICDEELEVKSKVGLALIRQFEQRFPDDVNYVLGRADKIKELDTAMCLLEWFNLDNDGQKIFANILGMPKDLLVETCTGIKWLANN